jgi:hypothetical protein
MACRRLATRIPIITLKQERWIARRNKLDRKQIYKSFLIIMQLKCPV